MLLRYRISASPTWNPLLAMVVGLSLGLFSSAHAQTHPSTCPCTQPTTMPTVRPVIKEFDETYVIFTWDKVPGAEAYVVYQVLPQGDNPLAVTGDTTSPRIPVNLQQGQTAEVKIGVVLPAGESTTLTSKKVGDVAENPNLPDPWVAVEAFGPSHSDVTFIWKDAQNATEYLVEYQSIGPLEDWSTAHPHTVSETITGPNLVWRPAGHHPFKLSRIANQPYRFRVTPRNKYGAGTTTAWYYWTPASK